MYYGTVYRKHYLVKSRLSYTSKVIERIVGGSNEDSIFA